MGWAQAIYRIGRTAAACCLLSTTLWAIDISPRKATVSEGATQLFTAKEATWKTSCGSISSAGLFKAPLFPGTCTVTATSTKIGPGHVATATAIITSPISITPAQAQLHAIAKQRFTANSPVTWSASCGSIDPSSGLFTAPTSTASCKVTATAFSGVAYTALARVNVDVVNYLSWKGDYSGTGLQSRETLLTPANVNSTQFGIKWSATLDGFVWAQPLYINGLTIGGVIRNVVFVATSNDSISAFDGDSGTLLWRRSFLSSGVTAIPAGPPGQANIVDSYIGQIGVLSTPVIDVSTGTLYAVAETAEQNSTLFPIRLHALDITTGNEKPNSPVLISDPNMAPIHRTQRTGLVLANGKVYLGIGSIGDRQPYHGLLFAYDANTLAEKDVWDSTPSGSEGGIWMAGGAPAVDSAGNLYVTTGNGTFDGSNNYGEAVVKLSPTLQVLDYFAPYNFSSLNAGDSDVGSASVAMLPDQNGQYAHELIVCGKTPSIYVLNRDSLGSLGTGSDNIIQRLDHVVGTSVPTLRDPNQACFGTPAIWNNNVYFVGNGDVMKVFKLDSNTGLLSSTPTAQGPFNYAWPGSQPVISSNGGSNGIVWTLNQNTRQLFANNASNISQQLYSTIVASGINRFSAPTVVNGFVYVGTQSQILAYSELP